jgi:hypothetical protein
MNTLYIDTVTAQEVAIIDDDGNDLATIRLDELMLGVTAYKVLNPYEPDPTREEGIEVPWDSIDPDCWEDVIVPEAEAWAKRQRIDYGSIQYA